MRRPRLARQFIAVLSLVSVSVLAFAAHVTYSFSQSSARAARIARSLQETSSYNRNLHEGLSTLINLVYRQFDNVEESFLDTFNSINYRLGENAANYLKLDIDGHERLVVESARELQSELGVQAVQIFYLLRDGKHAQATSRLIRLEEVEKQVDVEFAELNWLQTGKMVEVQKELENTVTTAGIAIAGMLAGLIGALIMVGVLIRRRVIQPLNSILGVSERIAQGDFSARAGVTARDEIGRLSVAVNSMAKSLARSYGELELKVEERTRQLKEVQYQLVQSEKLSAIGEMVGGVAHELNNPLSVILGYSELAKARFERERYNPDDIRTMELLHSQAERCRKIVANLLQFSHRGKPRMEEVRINQLIESVVELREYEFSTRNIALERDYDPAAPAICGDPDKIQQVILNLLNNAHDSILEKGGPGRISIRTSRVDYRVAIEVCDTGTGIREPHRIFEPFYTTKEVGKGTGLGLSVCYGIVEEHGGKIRAENRDVGARFVVELPVGDLASAQPTELPAPVEIVPSKERLALLVDDERSLVDLQGAFLSAMGVRSVGMPSADDAIEFLQNNEVDLVIADVRMPGATDGVGLFEWVRNNRPELVDRFLFISGDTQVLANLHPGASQARCLQKPFSLEEYTLAITRALES